MVILVHVLPYEGAAQVEPSPEALGNMDIIDILMATIFRLYDLI
jgi:hypothetical protein